MIPPSTFEFLRVCRSYNTLRKALILCVLAVAAPAASAAVSSAAKKSYELAAGDAAATLKQFVEQSGEQVLFLVNRVRGVKTNPVKGDFTAREALDRMVANTGLAVVEDERTGALMINRAAAGEPPAPSGSSKPKSQTTSEQPPQIMKRKTPVAVVASWLALALAPASPAQTTAAASDAYEEAKDSVVKLSPFQVVSEDKGYQATNTMSGTRLSSKLDDLGASISVVTKEQMADFALLDLNDIFNYEASTEGTGNYTSFSYNRNGEPESATQLNPQAANRIRGLGGANTTLGNFETSGRVPIDPLNIDAVEISRGPNASIFGIGSAAGTVNSVPSAANLSRNKSQLSLRVDSFEGHRSTIDLNRVLKRDVLAIRGSAAYQHDGFNLKPSGLDTIRLNGMVRFKPHKSATLTASYSTYDMHGNRPNVSPPRETISSWITAGRPTWDPVARTLKTNGVVTGTFPTSIPSVFTVAPQNVLTNFFIDQGGVGYVSTGQATSITNPNAGLAVTLPNSGNLVAVIDDLTGVRGPQPLYARMPTLTDKAMYDWSKINFAAANRVWDSAEIANVLWDQVILDTRRHLLAAQVGWFREQTERVTKNPIGAPTNVFTIAALHIDVNERLLDGSPNPYFGRPFYGASTPYQEVDPIDRDTYRGQLAYKLDLRGEKSWLRWLGMHQLTGYYEYKRIEQRRISSYQAIADKHSWLGAGVAHAGRGGSFGGMTVPGPNVAVGYFRYYLGDNQGYNVDHAPGEFDGGAYTMLFGNRTDGFVRENILMAPAVYGAGGGNSQLSILKSRGAIIQSHLLNGRMVTTFGVRRDQRFGKSGAPIRLLPDGVNLDYTSYDTWSSNNWTMGKGPTRTAGIVLKPLNWLSLHANKSDSFLPATIHQDVYLQVITDPKGKGEDYGFGLNLFNGKLHIRVNQYKTQSIERRLSQAQSFAVRVRNIDFSNSGNPLGVAFSLQNRAGIWVDAAAAAQGITLTADQRLQRISDIMKLPTKYLTPLKYDVDAVEDQVAEGNEIELHFNPTIHWTVKANIARQDARVMNMSPELERYIEERTAVWRTIIDPQTGQPWFTSRYVNQSAAEYLLNSVTAPLLLAKALDGKSLPQVRKYRFNLSTSYRLAGITDHKILKRLNVGGAMRWEDKGAIGFRGVQEYPAVVTQYDANRPIWDKSHLNLDAFFSYRAPLFSDKVIANWQLNVRNLTEGGGLKPISSDPDGRPNAYRIVDPRQFILSVTIDL